MPTLTNAPLARPLEETTLELDTVVDDDREDDGTLTDAEWVTTSCAAWCQLVEATFAVKATVVTERGPAGGNPIIGYAGKRAAVIALARTVYSLTDEDLLELYGVDVAS